MPRSAERSVFLGCGNFICLSCGSERLGSDSSKTGLEVLLFQFLLFSFVFSFVFHVSD